MPQLAQDLRFALRTIFRDRAFFAAAVIALGLGIGSTTAIFSVLYNVVVDPFPYRDSQRIVNLEIRDPSNPTRYGRNELTVPDSSTTRSRAVRLMKRWVRSRQRL